MAKILLTSVFKPFGSSEKYSADNLNSQHALPEFFHGQTTFKQGVFTLRGDWLAYGLDMIGLNISQPTTVLHYPSKEEFIKELRSTCYDFVGINGVYATFEKAKIMAELVRKYSPKSKIIFGGHLAEVPGAEKHCDIICRGEGVSFFRNLMGEKHENSNPLEFKNIVHLRKLSLLGFTFSKNAVIINSVGCPNGCDFCATSAKFSRKVISFTEEGMALFNQIREVREKTGATSITITDENFLLHKEQVNALSKAVQAYLHDNPDAKPFSFTVFGSLDAVKQFSPEELVKAGVGMIWLGEESFSSDYPKNRSRDFKRVIESLRRVGISTLCSFVVGLENHTKKTLEKDMKYHFSLEPTMSQFIIYGPLPGTPLWERLSAEGRILDLPNIYIDGFSSFFRHNHLSGKEIEDFQDKCYQQDYKLLGPSIYRGVKVFFRGYKNLSKSRDSILRRCAESYADSCKRSIMLMDAFICLAPTKKLRREMNLFKDELIREFGVQPLRQFVAKIVLAKALIQKHLLPQKMVFNPKLIRNIYNS